MSFYYFALTAITLAIAVFNLSIKSTGSNYSCFKLQTLDEVSYNSFKEVQKSNNVTIPEVTEFTQNNVKYYLVPSPSSNIYGVIASIIAIGYLIIMGLSLLLTLVLLWMSDMVPEDFVKISWIKKFSAVTTKIFPPLLVILHWIIGILIIVFWITIGLGQCEVSEPQEAVFGFNRLKYHDDCITLEIVNSCVFILLHYVAAIVKDMIYVEPFMYAPVVGEASPFLDFALKTVGP
jgi:hypothetical protein